jgi:hypothetical protein
MRAWTDERESSLSRTRTQEYPMTLRTNIPDPDDMNLQRALWATTLTWR